MKLGCPPIYCPRCKTETNFVKAGFYRRKDDAKWIQRFRCKNCQKHFSRATHNLACGQKKRRFNARLFKLLASGVSQRRSARILGLNKNTIKGKLLFLSKVAALKQERLLNSIAPHSLSEVQFDDLITTEHTKLKPLSVSCAVEEKSRLILGTKVSSIPAFGLLAAKSRQKYGKRKNQHPAQFRALLRDIHPLVSPEATFKSDEHKTYPLVLKKVFPRAKHTSYKGGRGCVTGQGELKRKNFDPLFSINHVYAMLRANINRLFRRTWCTTKDPTMLQHHLNIYTWRHNEELICHHLRENPEKFPASLRKKFAPAA